MRPAIAYLDSEAMAWETRGPGVYSKVLSRDPDNGARTALQRLVPSEGYTAPTIAHYHHSDEEILVVKGRLSFDSKTYFGALGYCFHPAETVHGFKSDVPEETWFLSRHSKQMCTHNVPEPTKREWYSVGEAARSRALSVVADARTAQWRDCGAGSEELCLGEDTVSGEGSKLVRLRGAAAAALDVPAHFYREIFVLEGSLAAEDGTTFGRSAYAFSPPDAARPAFAAAKDALVYLNYGP